MERAGFEARLLRAVDGLPPLLLGRPVGIEAPHPVPASVDRD